MTITGQVLIGHAALDASGSSFHAVNPATRQLLEPAFRNAGVAQIDRACELAAQAFGAYRAVPAERRAALLERIAQGIESLGESLIERAMAESALPRGRLEGERGRTCGQLRLFARVLRDGLWQQLTLDSALPQRQPNPGPDLRMRQIGLGPVAVFGASNFPLAFSVAGGDSAAALAAGCPVVVKAHPSHPGTSELVGRVLRDSVRDEGLPEGVFSMVGGTSPEVGAHLVSHPAICAVAFTGSRAGGLALWNLVQRRAQPIPMYAEMSSINPVFLLPGALAQRAEQLATGFVDSLLLGVGQFCTSPGVVLGIAGADWQRFVAGVHAALAGKTAGTMLNQGIHGAYLNATQKRLALEGVKTVAEGQPAPAAHWAAQARVHEVSAKTWLTTTALEEEIFGPSALLVHCDNLDQLREIVDRLSGQLTATLHLRLEDADDMAAAQLLLPALETKTGRILVNGFPTGVEVSFAMVHGGPFPATTDSRSTSVGANAIARFLRPVCYQNFPQGLLPQALRDDQLRASWRLVDGSMVAPTST